MVSTSGDSTAQDIDGLAGGLRDSTLAEAFDFSVFAILADKVGRCEDPGGQIANHRPYPLSIADW